MVDDLFAIPFLTGLGLAVMLPLLGCYLRLRDAWLAALAYAHVAAAGALVAAIAGLPVLLGGAAGAVLAGGINRARGGAGFALMMLGGWGLAILLAANQPLAERLGHALFDGQLFFADMTQLLWVVASLAMFAVAMRLLSRPLLLAQLYPDLYRQQVRFAWPTQRGFDIGSALILALATTSLGVMGAFALVFVPPWLAFRRGRNWRQGLLLAVMIGVLAYLAAFVSALMFDQPFGPVLALVLVIVGLVVA